MKLSIIIPVYNEENTLPEVLDRVRRVPYPKEIIVVDDGSTDRTPEILGGKRAEGCILLRHPVNRGKGAAIRTALDRAKGDLVIIQDADLEYAPEDYARLLQPIQQDGVKVVYGSRVLGNPGFYGMGVMRFYRDGYFRNPFLALGFYFGGRTVTWLTNLLFGSSLTDQPTCYKLFRREVLNDIRLTSDGFDFCSEITAKLLRKGHSIVEVPITYRPRRVSEGKKLGWRDGVQAVKTLLRLRLFPDS